MTGRKSKDISRRRKFPFCRCTILQQCDKKKTDVLGFLSWTQVIWHLAKAANHLEVDCAVRKIQDRICDDVAKNIIRSPPSVPYLQKLDLLSMHILAFTLLGFSVVPAAGKVKNSWNCCSRTCLNEEIWAVKFGIRPRLPADLSRIRIYVVETTIKKFVKLWEARAKGIVNNRKARLDH